MPDIRTKYAHQVAGFGLLPESYARGGIEAGQPNEKAVQEPKPPETFYLAWRRGESGAALAWWLERMRVPGKLQHLLGMVRS